jgi:pyroglutamyl-peptidase
MSPYPSRTLVTGFLAFGQFDVNPSSLLARSLDRRFELIEVSFAAVDEFVERLASDDGFDRLLMLGVAGDRGAIKIERCARNWIGDIPDVRGEIRGPALIDPAGPDRLPLTPFEPAIGCETLGLSDDAGCYLCNYAYYRALRRLPHKRIAFIHVPPVERIPLDAQRVALIQLIDAMERQA